MKLPPPSKTVFHLIKTVLSAAAILGLTSVMPVVRMEAAETRHILLQSSTSTLNSGLYDVLLPAFTKTSGIEVRVVAVGSGQALRNAANCDGDLVLAHAPTDEKAFMEEGFGARRLAVMQNRFVLIGPADDPAKIKDAVKMNAALKAIAESGARFLSRGDNSGTHTRERLLWTEAEIDLAIVSGSWYLEAGQGMGASINLAVQLDAYLLSDISTWLAFGNKAGHRLLFEDNSESLLNRYSILTVNPDHCPFANHDGANQFADWLTSPEGQQQIAAFKLGGKQMFTPISQSRGR